MRNDIKPRNLEESDASVQARLRAEIARRVYGDMCSTFAEDQDVNVSVSDAMVTVGAGRRAVQIQALDPERFLISFRRRHSFHMHPGTVPSDKITALVEGFMREQ